MGLLNKIFAPNVQRLEKRSDIAGLIQALNYEGDWLIRKQAAYALGSLRDKRAVEPFIAALQDSEIEDVVIWALGKIGDPSAIEPLVNLSRRRSDLCHRIIEALGEIGKPAVPVLITFLADKDEFIKKWAASALGRVGDTSAVEPLIVVLKQSRLPAAAIALGKIGDKRAEEILVRGLNYPSFNDAAACCAEALIECGTEYAIQPLIEALHNSQGTVRVNAAKALRKQFHGSSILEESKNQILEQRELMAEPLKVRHSVGEHYDKGIGIDLEQWPA